MPSYGNWCCFCQTYHSSASCYHPANHVNPTVTVQYNLSPAMIEGAIRDKLIELGWTPPKESESEQES